MYDVLGYRRTSRGSRGAAAIDDLLVIKDDELIASLRVADLGHGAAAHALLEVGSEAAEAAAERGPRLAEAEAGPGRARRLGDREAGRAPGRLGLPICQRPLSDLDDTAVVVMAMNRAQGRLAPALAAATVAPWSAGREWVEGLQSRTAAGARFDADKQPPYLNHSPSPITARCFDPPTADVTARCVSMLGQLGETPKSSAALARG
jgi:squalene-hopene/tetraprenyl-beta-curcumene cyclase